MSIPLFFGSSTGNTENAAELMKEKFKALNGTELELINVGDIEADQLSNHDTLIIGIPTWETGELQQDWDYLFTELDELDFSAKKVAIFGQGDAMGYPDTFQDGIGILAKKFRELGAEIIGLTSTEGYDYEESVAEENGKFLGLCLDEDNQPELSEERIESWVGQIAAEFQ